MRLSTLIATISGAILGSAITYIIMKSKAETYIQNEIDKYKEEAGHTAPIPFAEKTEDIPAKQAEQYATSEPRFHDYNKPYTMSVSTSPAIIPAETKNLYEITFEEFDSENEFMKETYMVWPDGYVTDTADNILSDIDGTVGRKILSALIDGDLEEAYVRNEEIRMDFELVRAKDNYEDVIGVHPDED